MEFILQSQAETETRLAGITKLMQQGMRVMPEIQEAQRRTDARLAESQSRNDARLAESQSRNDARLAESQRRLDARLAESQERTDAKFREVAHEMKELAKAQKLTERMFQAFIKGQRNGRNGR